MRFEEVILRGARSAQPAANTVTIGSLYYVTDEFVTERSNGTSWDSYSDGGGNANLGVALVRRALTESEFETLFTTPIQLIPAAGADKIIIPIQLSMEVNLTTLYGTSPTFSIVYDGSTTNLMNTTVAFNLTATIAKKLATAVGVSGASPLYVYTTFDPRNKSVKIRASADLGAGAATAIVTLAYFVARTL